ncbi:hypothetical protein CA984_26745 [Streptosporangium minutum]|uniref:Uncharacterized protein n=1 Tax=Streptosporangium minutum TaxID=569862 RepID=A0A243REY5_9ACTN|nr:hypothetical protein CA984_26745 [Streptosporangium minutum]
MPSPFPVPPPFPVPSSAPVPNAVPVPGAAPVPGAVPTPGARTGQGLVGLAERVALADGRLEHGPTAAGGWRLSAWLPWPP